MNNIPEFLKVFLEENNYKLEELLQYNSRKKTYVLRVKYKATYYLLKAFDKDKTSLDIKEKFIIEKEFYKKNKTLSNIPKLVSFQDNILVFEYFESISLRDFLINNDNKIEIIKNLINSIEIFDINVYRENNDIVEYDNVFRYISSLCNSHPFQVKDIKINFIDRILNKIINKFLILKAKKVFDKLETIKLKNAFSHNDFHYNNILVSNSNEIKFIDFENVMNKGFFEFDILFLIVIVELYLDRNEQEIIDNYLDEIFDKNFNLREIYIIFQMAISINEKFHIESKTKSLNKLDKIKLLLSKEFRSI
jgi:thiamine kinase-like enzyme